MKNLLLTLLLCFSTTHAWAVVDFQGDGDEVSCTETVLSGQQDFSIVALVDNDVSGFNRIVYLDDEFLLSITNQSPPGMYCAVVGSSTTNGWFSGASAGDGFKHLVCTWDDSASDMNLYSNGNQKAENALSPSITTKTDDVLFIGSRDNTSFFNGRIYYVAIFDRVLTQAEVTHLYESKLLDAPLQLGAIRYYPLYDVSPGESIENRTFIEVTGNGNNCTGNDNDGDGVGVALSTFTLMP